MCWSTTGAALKGESMLLQAVQSVERGVKPGRGSSASHLRAPQRQCARQWRRPPVKWGPCGGSIPFRSETKNRTFVPPKGDALADGGALRRRDGIHRRVVVVGGAQHHARAGYAHPAAAAGAQRPLFLNL